MSEPSFEERKQQFIKGLDALSHALGVRLEIPDNVERINGVTIIKPPVIVIAEIPDWHPPVRSNGGSESETDHEQ